MTNPLPLADYPHGFAIDMTKPGAGEAVRSIMARMARPRDAAGGINWDRRQARAVQLKLTTTRADHLALQTRFQAEDDACRLIRGNEDMSRRLWGDVRFEAAVAVRAERVGTV